MVLQIKSKRDIKSRKVKKWKARLKIDGSRTTKGVHYDQTYAPVASWQSIRMLLTMMVVNRVAYPAAWLRLGLPTSACWAIPIHEGTENFRDWRQERGRLCPQDPPKHLQKKQADRVWNKYLVQNLVNVLGFKIFSVNGCVFYRGKTLYILYTDASILAGPDRKEVYHIIKDMKKSKLDITILGDLQDFLWVNIERKLDGSINLNQHHFIDQIIKDLRLEYEQVTTKPSPASSSVLLLHHAESEAHDV